APLHPGTHHRNIAACPFAMDWCSRVALTGLDGLLQFRVLPAEDLVVLAKPRSDFPERRVQIKLGPRAVGLHFRERNSGLIEHAAYCGRSLTLAMQFSGVDRLEAQSLSRKILAQQ